MFHFIKRKHFTFRKFNFCVWWLKFEMTTTSQTKMYYYKTKNEIKVGRSSNKNNYIIFIFTFYFRSQRSCHVHDCTERFTISFNWIRRHIRYIMGYENIGNDIKNQVNRQNILHSQNVLFSHCLLAHPCFFFLFLYECFHLYLFLNPCSDESEM